MKIRRVWVDNYRAISTTQLDVGANTALVGENNAGKSSVISAINLFFDTAPKISVHDYHNRDTSKPVVITLEFVELTPEELRQFEGNLVDGKLRVAREFHHNDPKANGRFAVQADVFPQFDDCRNETTAKLKREKYSDLRITYPELPAVARADEIDGYLEGWEAANPELLERSMVSGFRGFKNVAAGQLRKKTDIVYVPAVQDAGAEIGDAKKSPVKQLLNTIARQTIENSTEFREFKARADEELRRITSPDNVPELSRISNQLTEILGRYYKGSELKANWDPISDLPVEYPTSDITVKDNSFEASIENVGHGLQRAVLFSVLEFLAIDRAALDVEDAAGDQFDKPESDIILLIEEPEIYQHPIKQRLFRKAFKSLTEQFNKRSGIRIQIVYTTHSPLLVDIRDFDEICVLRRDHEQDPPSVLVHRASIEKCADTIARIKGEPVDYERYRLGLHIFSPEIAEGFFAKKVVLVEGVGDKAILDAYYTQQGRDHVADGIHVVDAVGKKKFDKPLAIFQQLSIPVFCIFDNDEPKRRDGDYNRILQRMCGVEEAVDWPSGCSANFAAFDGKLERYLKGVVGDDYTKIRDQVCAMNEINPSDAFKSPLVAAELLGVFIGKGFKFDLLDQIVEAIDAQ